MGSLIEPPGCVWRPGTFWPAADKKRQFPQEYGSWNSARRRCHDPDNSAFPGYGGRGITMCPQWFVSFDAFIDHIGPKPSPQHSLDRIDNHRGYEPGNVRWATDAQQSANRRLPHELLPPGGQETMAAKLREAGWSVFAPGELTMQRIEHEGVRMRVIPVELHNVLCTWRVATPQGITPEVLGCAGCGFCYPMAGDPADIQPQDGEPERRGHNCGGRACRR